MMKELKIYAAPLQGFTELAWRNAHEKVFGGIDAYFTPFVRMENGKFRNKDLRDIDPLSNTTSRLIPQIIASEPEEMVFLVDLIEEKGYHEIDINMGCPFPLIANRGKGSGILAHPEKIKNLLDVAERYSDISFSVKMRLGWISSEEWKPLLAIFNDSCLKRITLHPRIGKQQYKGKTDMESFTQFYEECKIPLVYNGDLTSCEQIQQLSADYPLLEGIMIGRGLLSNPALAMEYRFGNMTSESELYRKIYRMHTLIESQYTQSMEGGEAQLLSKLKTIWDYLLPAMNRKHKKAIMKARNLKEYDEKVYVALNL